MSGGFKGRSKVKHLALFSEQPKRREKTQIFASYPLILSAKYKTNIFEYKNRNEIENGKLFSLEIFSVLCKICRKIRKEKNQTIGPSLTEIPWPI